MEIIPAILPKNFREIEEKVSMIVGISNIVQIDICDGKFVPTITWPYWKSEVKVEENFDAILKEERGMPEWEKVDYEFDLMINNPTMEDLNKWITVGAKKVIFHLESSTDLSPVLTDLVEVGIAININSDIEKLRPYIDKIQFIQIMGIRKAGFQGQKFEIATIDKIKEVKKMFPGMKVQVDGGVSLDNAHILKEAGVDSVVVGSALFGDADSSEDIFDSIEKFRML
jgi:ribulose-phosphate 3-epimerase